MKRIICIGLALVMLAAFASCAEKNANESNAKEPDLDKETVTEPVTVEATAQDTATDEPSESTPMPSEEGTPERMVQYYVPALKGTIAVPEDYYVFIDGGDYTDEMCAAVGLARDQVETYMSATGVQVYIIPKGDQFAKSKFRILLHVKDKKYGDVTFADISESEYNLYASSIISGFEKHGADGYQTVEKNGLRFMLFNYVFSCYSYRYATVINGHMIYTYGEKADKQPLSPEQEADVAAIAVSMVPGL